MALEIAVQTTQSLKTIPPSDQFGFGKYFSDHMFLCEYSTEQGWHSPRIVPYGPLPLDPGASVLHYGQALFEGMKAFRGEDGKVRIFRPEKNWKRLCDGAARLAMQAPSQEIFMKAIEKFVQIEERWVPTAKGTALYLRPTLIGTEGFLGVRPSNNYLFFIIGSPAGGYFGEGIEAVKIWVEKKYSRCAPGGIGAVKAGGNYASSLVAALEAKKKGYSQVLWLDSSQHRFVEEVGTMNVFFVIDKKVITPPLHGTILPGVMRDSAIQALKDTGFQVEERPISIDEVAMAHERGLLTEVFGTGTAASVSPVGQLGFEERVLLINDGRPGPVARDLYAKLVDIQYGRSTDEHHWTIEVKKMTIEGEILELKKKHNAVILAHYYEDGAIQDIADYIGDSLYLAQLGEKLKNPVVLLAGVVFMAESVKLLSPEKTVLVPDLGAGCSLVDTSPYERYLDWRRKHPEAIAVTYVNSSAAVKSISDVCVTSSNAEKIIGAIPADRMIAFGPDRNLGRYLSKKLNRDMIFWPGSCQVHVLFSARKLFELKTQHPTALVLAHPECSEAVLQYADVVGSTSRLLEEVRTNMSTNEFIVATEDGIFHEMRKSRPGVQLIQAPAEGSCACNQCPYMKMNSLEKIRSALTKLEPAVSIPEKFISTARLPLDRMMAITEGRPVTWPSRFET